MEIYAAEREPRRARGERFISAGYRRIEPRQFLAFFGNPHGASKMHVFD